MSTTITDPLKTDNQAPTDWRAGLPPELQKESVFESIKGKDWAEAGPILAKGYHSAQKMVGADKLVLPTKDSTPEQIADFRKKLGVPDKFTDYAVALPEGLTEDKLDKKLLDTWRERLHKQGVPKAAAEGIIKDYLTDNVGFEAEKTKAAEKQRLDWDLELKQKFGTDYDKNINLARHALAEFVDPKLTEWLDSTGAGNHPAVVEFFAKVGKGLSDDVIRSGSGTGGGGPPKTAAAAEALLNSRFNDQEWYKALHDEKSPRHEAVVKERMELFKQAYPSGATE